MWRTNGRSARLEGPGSAEVGAATAPIMADRRARVKKGRSRFPWGLVSIAEKSSTRHSRARQKTLGKARAQLPQRPAVYSDSGLLASAATSQPPSEARI